MVPVLLPQYVRTLSPCLGPVALSNRVLPRPGIGAKTRGEQGYFPGALASSALTGEPLYI